MIVDFSKVITKNLILSKVSEEEIFTKYGAPVQYGSFRSPIRTDKKPTCNFYRRRDNRLCLIDHSGNFNGDCFDFAMRSVPGHLTFGKILNQIAVDFHLTDGVVMFDRKPIVETYIAREETCDIRVQRREWNAEDEKYWGRWQFKKSTLELYHISPIERAWANGEPIYAYMGRKGDEAYVYHFGQYDYKIYFPYRQKGRFRHNNSWLLQGYLQLPASGEFLVITKSLKDVAKLYEFGIPAVAPMSETTIPSEDALAELSERFGRLIVLYDNDWPGKRQMVKIAKTYYEKFALEFIVFPQHYPKDFTDYFEQRGHQNTVDLIETVKSELNLN